MASTILGAMAGASAMLALLAAAGATLGAVASMLSPRAPAAPAMGCAFSGLVWACLAIVLGWMSSALAGR